MIKQVLCIGLAAVAAVSFAQGGFGGGEFGGAGGSAAGDMAGSNSFSSSGSSFRHTMILTPGEYVEFPFEVEAGKGIRAHVQSSIFDAAVEILDESGKVLFEQDDPVLGTQDPRFYFRFPAKGKYRIRVKSFKSAAGGTFTFSGDQVNMIRVEDAPSYRGKDTYEDVYIEVPLKAGELSALGVSVAGITRNFEIEAPESDSRSNIPNLVLLQNFPNRSSFNSAASQIQLMRSNKDITIYVKTGVSTPDYALAFTKRVVPIGKPDSTMSLELIQPVITKRAMKEGEYVELRLNSNEPEAKISSAWFEVTEKPKSSNRSSPPPLIKLEKDPKDPHLVRFLAVREGVLYVVAETTSPSRSNVVVEDRQFVEDWSSSDSKSGAIQFGEYRYFAVDVKLGQSLEVSVRSDDFDVVMGIINDYLDIQKLDDSTGSRNPTYKIVNAQPGRYVFFLHALGNGSKGRFEIRKKVEDMPTLVRGKDSIVELRQNEITTVRFACKAGDQFYVEISGEIPGHFQAQFRSFKEGRAGVIALGSGKVGMIAHCEKDGDLLLQFANISKNSKVTIRNSPLPLLGNGV